MQISQEQKLPILLCFDINYANYAAVATYSAFINSNHNLVFYWLVADEAYEKGRLLKEQLKPLGIHVELLAVDLSPVSLWKTGAHFTKANYLRLFVPDVLSDLAKIVYIDCDTLVLGDIADLYKVQLGEALFAGVIDEKGAGLSLIPRDSKDHYINSGVLVMNLDGLRADKFLEKSKAVYETYQDRVQWVDQCIINKYAENRKLSLDSRWNRQIFPNEIALDDFKKIANSESSSILHFVGPCKPWQGWCNPVVANFWWEYASKSKLQNINSVQITNIGQLVDYANVLHFNQSYQASSEVKSQAIQLLNEQLQVIERNSIEKRRIELSNRINEFFGGVVRYGLFKGLRLVNQSWWGAADRAGMLVGLYEQEILKSLAGLRKQYRCFIDIGAADGYYGVGVLMANLFEKSYCFEISAEGQKVIKENAEINNLTDRVSIKGIAKQNFYLEIPEADLENSVLFVDIEGGEFELFAEDNFERFKRSVIFIELHEWFFENGLEKLEQLESKAREFFSISEITTTNRDLSGFKEFEQLHDNDRWLLCSEGRPRLMKWWRLDPLN